MKKRAVLHAALYVAVLIAAGLLTCAGLSHWLDLRVAELCEDTYPYAYHEYDWEPREKGGAAVRETLKNGELLILASSELNADVPQVPQKMFPNNLYPRDVTCVGHSFVQNCLHGMFLGANAPDFRGNDVVVVESLQWFLGKAPDIDGFLANFSELQFMKFLENDRISQENKDYLCRRFVELYSADHMQWDDFHTVEKKLENMPQLQPAAGLMARFNQCFRKNGYAVLDGDVVYPQTYLLARLYTGDSTAEKVIYRLLQPYYSLRREFLELKDKFQVYMSLREAEPGHRTEPVQIQWDETYAEAEKIGKLACEGNDLFVDNDYYEEYLQYVYDDVVGVSTDAELMVSSEWEDFRFLLSVCRDLGIEPMIVEMGVNGYYYDRLGITQDRRTELYDRVRAMCEEFDVPYFSMQDREYEHYVYCDVMHLGWKGWTYVAEGIIENFAD